jgi:hypothetical protein
MRSSVLRLINPALPFNGPTMKCRSESKCLMLAFYVFVLTVLPVINGCGGGGGDSEAVSPAVASWTGIKMSGSTSDDRALGIASDSIGNVYITGYTNGNLDGETNAGGRDAFIAKYDSSGVRKWTRLLGTSLDDVGAGIAVDSNDNVYITGYTYGNLDGHINSGSSDAFIAKYDSAGNKIWVYLIGTAGADDSAGIAIDSGGHIYIAWTASDAHISKYDSNGNLQWSVLLEPQSTYVRATGIATDSSGNSYITGVVTGGYHFFIAKYSPSGTRLWIEVMGDTEGEDHSYGVAVDSLGNSYITGFTSSFVFDGHLNNGQSHMGAGTPDVFLVKFDPSGNKLWSLLLGTYLSDFGAGIAVNQSGTIFIAGRTEGNLSGNSNSGSTDIFFAAYDPSGNNLWTHLLGTTVEDAGYGVAVDKNNNIFITGYSFGVLGGNVNMGEADIFIAKYDSHGALQ